MYIIKCPEKLSGNSYLVISNETNHTYTWDETLRSMHVNTDELNTQDFMIPGKRDVKDWYRN